MEQKIRVGAVSYLNTKPLVFGFEKGQMAGEIELLFDYPANIASRLLHNQIDVGLIPVAVIPQMKEHYIISDFCIGAEKKVGSVMLYSEVSLNQIENILNVSTEPTVNVRYEVIEYRLGKVGKLEVMREPWKLPYRAAKDVVIDDTGRKGLIEGNIYVRHGSQTEAPSAGELAALEEEGKRAREQSPTN